MTSSASAFHRPQPGLPSGRSLLPAVGIWLVACSLWCGAAAAGLPPRFLDRLDPSLVVAFSSAPDETVSVWISFADKGERSAGDLAARLSAADAALSPRARARRVRAGVWPLVDYQDLPLHPPYLEALAGRGWKPYASSRWLNRVAVRVPARRLEEMAALPFVQRLSPVERMWRAREPESGVVPGALPVPARVERAAVDYGRTLDQLTQIHVPSVHDAGYNGAGVLITVLDEGFNYFDKHEALRDLSVPPEFQRDFVRGLHTVQDTLSAGMEHGTWVLGCIAGRKPGAYVGAAYGADIALARTEIHFGENPVEMVYWGMGAEWADSLGADIISSSLGYTTFDPGNGVNYSYADMDGHTTVVSRAAEIAASKGILVVNAVGNQGASAWHYLVAPSDVDGDSVIAVGAVNPAGDPISFSSYGPSADGRVKPDLAALGLSNPLVAADGDPQGYTIQSGTSFATPLVAGLAACLMQAHPTWTPRDVARALRATASRSGSPDDRVGYGIPNGQAALAWGSLDGTITGRAPRLDLAGPNPFVPSRGPAQFRLGIGVAGGCPRSVALRVYDAGGRQVRALWSGVLPCQSPVTVSWDGLDQDGRRCAAGLYLVDLRAGGDHASLRMVCLR
jgi:serine protease AprX